MRKAGLSWEWGVFGIRFRKGIPFLCVSGMEIGFMQQIRNGRGNLIGKNIRRLRIERGLRSMDVVCRLQLKGIGISSSTFSKIESGHSNPSVEMIMALTEIFQCGYGKFFVEPDTPY